jgi:SAM-dependent methyltransferase
VRRLRHVTKAIQPPAEYFDPSYFQWQAERALASARTVVPTLIELFHPGSVLDIGCGTGAWLQAFIERGVSDVLGIDGDYVARSDLRISPDRFLPADLEALPPLERRFDVAISLEAAHYAAQSAARSIVATLCAADVIYFSAAVPGQPGGPGQNLQWPAYWSELFAEHGYRCVDVLRSMWWEHPEVDWWYAQNGLLFVSSELPQPEGTGTPRSLVHPLLLAELTADRSADIAEAVPERPRRLTQLLRRGG